MATATAEPLVLVHDDGPVRTVTLNRPRQSNAMSMTLVRQLLDALEDTAGADCSVVVLTGAGRSFCAGMDLSEIGSDGGALLRCVTTDDSNPFRLLAELPQVTIAAVNGPAVTGGLELALACDLVVASTQASFVDTHARVGVLSAQGMPALLSAAVGPQVARWMSLTGRPLSAQRAYDLGLVSALVSPDQLASEARDLARRLTEADPEARSAINRLYRSGPRQTMAAWLADEQRLFAEHLRNGEGPDLEDGAR